MDLVTTTGIKTMSDGTMAKITKFADVLRTAPQVQFKTTHMFHAGMYLRTCVFPKGIVLTGVPIKIPTVLTLVGDCAVVTEHGTILYSGYNVLPCSEHRMACMLTLSEVFMQMSFASTAKTVEEAEKEFTDQYQDLMSHGLDNEIIITEES